ncbi:hypothetical protein [Amycolatopsis jiangsuensis]|uniref:Uncharacterized protein n=1 Tax=Amycolatopsis jiangsuensis TaxID=1181879 RepID=A0A840INH1_9PSEU|nr:hypothetical protein [Amycolatopsis jiangsuensis]MBB4682752.1 hypothetical protein [Amycolatopsis jiangsuensis]
MLQQNRSEQRRARRALARQTAIVVFALALAAGRGARVRPG